MNSHLVGWQWKTPVSNQVLRSKRTGRQETGNASLWTELWLSCAVVASWVSDCDSLGWALLRHNFRKLLWLSCRADVQLDVPNAAWPNSLLEEIPLKPVKLDEQMIWYFTSVESKDKRAEAEMRLIVRGWTCHVVYGQVLESAEFLLPGPEMLGSHWLLIIFSEFKKMFLYARHA